MATLTRTTDRKARVSLPQSFANATVIIEQISDTELRIRKAQVTRGRGPLLRGVAHHAVRPRPAPSLLARLP